MKTYLISVVSAALVASLVGILSPKGERDGIGRHLHLLCSLFLIAVLISPLSDAVHSLADRAGNLFARQTDPPINADTEKQMQTALDEASKEYLANRLTELLETEFSIAPGELRCGIAWSEENGQCVPRRVTVVMSGRAKWKDPRPIEERVRSLLGCECRSAVE